MFHFVRPWAWFALLGLVCIIGYHFHIQREMADFHVYRTAAGRVLQGAPLYQLGDGHYQFKYLPVFALAAIPLALVGADIAKAAWFGVSIVLLVTFILRSGRALPDRRRPLPVVLGLTTMFMVKFYVHELTLGQTNVLLGVLLIGGLLALQNGSPRIAGLCVALAVFVKPYALILLPWLLVSSGVTATLVACVALAAGLLLPAVIYGWSGNLELLAAWYHTVTASTAGNLLGADNVSIAAMWAKWIGVGPAAAALAMLTVAALLGLVAVIWLRRRGVAHPDYLEYALLMLLIPLVSPQGWDYVLLLGTPAVVCVLDRWSRLSRAWQTLALASLVLMGLTFFDLMGRAFYGRFMALSLVTVAALGLTATLAHLRWQRAA